MSERVCLSYKLHLANKTCEKRWGGSSADITHILYLISLTTQIS